MTQYRQGDYSALDRPQILSSVFYPRPDFSPEAPEGAQDLFIPVEEGVSLMARAHQGPKRGAGSDHPHLRCQGPVPGLPVRGQDLGPDPRGGAQRHLPPGFEQVHAGHPRFGGQGGVATTARHGSSTGISVIRDTNWQSLAGCLEVRLEMSGGEHLRDELAQPITWEGRGVWLSSG